jgi:hypothetical protein
VVRFTNNVVVSTYFWYREVIVFKA